MKKLLNFVFWPALAGLVISITLLQTPRLISMLPALSNYFPHATTQQLAPSPTSLSFGPAIKKALPAVVSVNNLQLVNRRVSIPVTLSQRLVGNLVRNFEDENNTLGSGVIISQDGYIVTSYHLMFNPEINIIRPDQEITVTLNDKRTVEANLVFIDAKSDLALLKIDAEHITHIQLPPTENLQIGDIALAIGNPRNIGQSVSQGIISALWKLNDSYVIQTDAAINPGNSGGALIDINGNFIGVNSTIVSQSGGSEGISFAVPASKAINLLAQYLTAQKLDTGISGYLGVDASQVEIEEANGNIQGFEINGLTPQGAADMAGLRMGDVIIAVNDQRLPTVNDPNDEAEARRMVAAISDLPPGTLIMLEILRNKESIRVPTILGIGEPKVYVNQTNETVLEGSAPSTEVISNTPEQL